MNFTTTFLEYLLAKFLHYFFFCQGVIVTSLLPLLVVNQQVMFILCTEKEAYHPQREDATSHPY